MSSVNEVNDNEKSASAQMSLGAGGIGVQSSEEKNSARYERAKARAVKGSMTDSGESSSRKGSPIPDHNDTPAGEESRRGRGTRWSSKTSRIRMVSRSRSASERKTEQCEW